MKPSDPFEQGLAVGEAAASAAGGASSTAKTSGRMYVRTQCRPVTLLSIAPTHYQAINHFG